MAGLFFTDYPPSWEKIPPVEDPGLCLGHTFPFLRAIVHDCHNPGETCLIRAHTLRDLDQRCEVVDERRGTGKSPDCFELFKTVVENRRSERGGSLT